MTVQSRHGAEAGTEELRQEVDRARHELGDTVEQLAAKADVKALAREKAEYARGRARDAAASAWQAAGSEETMARARQGGAVVVSAGALAAAALWMRRRRTSSRRVGPVRFRIAAGQRRAVKVRRGKGR
ncbi:DUF3618 domain-containing protein [Actinomadura sp. NAK00032]|uniref:DUF3618 domain-containing protein n=1 Tax=Actinomadura sp. NAK00032 TaxID=2742128 RepID=UPI0015916CAA|nr:DUF3618 domain-containing protein [Actinomadura sp. NAK00032]QKW36199.1 DUF3618 domain-containing protein [Actinomadura sp. NAK00032]